MTLDDRGPRAADGLRRAIRPVARPSGEQADRFERFVEGKQQARRWTAGAVGLALAIAVAVPIVRGLGPLDQRRPAAPLPPPGRILFGDYDSGTQLSHWYTVRPDGSALVDLELTGTCATWYPDGDRILVTDDALRPAPASPLRPAVAAPDGSGARSLNGVKDRALELGCGDVSPDGSTIALEGFGNGAPHRDLDGIYSVRASDGGGLIRLIRGPVTPPRYSPDGSQLAFIDSKPGVMPSGAGAVFVMGADGANPTRVTPWGYAFDIPAWSPDGRWITFQKPYGQIWVVHPDGSDLHRLPIDLPEGTGASNPSWSPDGRWIVFGLQRGDGSAIYRAHPDGTGLQRVIAIPGAREDTPVWGPRLRGEATPTVDAP